jgi:flagellar assembly factor FliW
MSKQTIFWTKLGLNSLEDVKNFILQEWDDEILGHFLNLTDKRIEQIRVNPRLAPIVFKTNFRKLVIHKNISLLYEIVGLKTKILFVWDNRKKPKALFNKLNTSKVNN